MPWTCACGHGNDDESRFCNQCGAPRAEEPGKAPEPEPELEFGEDALPVPAANLPHRGTHPAEGAPVVAGGPPPTPPPKKSNALVIVLVLVVVGLVGTCVLGIIAAIAIPNFISAKERAKQKRAVAEVRAIGEAVQKYQIDNGSCPDTGHQEGAYYSIVGISELDKFIVPKYLKELPAKDPWNGTYSYGVSPDNAEFVLICDGSDNRNSIEKIPEEPVTTSCFEDDIIFENGEFVQKPEGPQKKCK